MPRRAALSLLLVAGGLALVTVVPGGQAAGSARSQVALVATPPIGRVAQVVSTAEQAPTPQGRCGPGSVPEPGLQGRVPDATPVGYRCNVEVVGTAGESGGFKVERYVDAAGHECAYYDTTLVFPTNAVNITSGELTGVAVLDMSDPANPVRTTTLVTPAMQSPHESLLLNKKRGLLAAVAGNLVFAPGQVDLYDVSADCRAPVLASTLPVGTLGHESGFAPDGNTFYTASLGGGTITGIDVTDPAAPEVVWLGRFDTHALSISDDGNRAYLAAGAGFPRNEIGLPAALSGLVVLDISEVQARVPDPQTRIVGSTTWPNVTIPQAALPFTVDGKPYLIESDEFSTDDAGRVASNGPHVGAARIIDVSDETAPQVVSDLRLEVNEQENRATVAGDPGATSPTGGYAGHYCAIPQRADPGIAACTFLASGLRVFDIRDPRKPVEIAYFVAPTDGGPNAALASASFVPERSEVWYSDGDRGFYVLRLTNGVWPAARPAAAPSAAAPAPPVQAPP
ncbi:MAG: hypothetical protein JWN08_3610, partial [Frankiales bacterium]|nr:hypothetical protein [Frankiales bacterium]